MLDFLGKSAYNKDNKSGNQASHLTRQEENPLTELLSPKGGLLYLVLTAREPSVKPLADVVGRYIRCDGQDKGRNRLHWASPPFP